VIIIDTLVIITNTLVIDMYKLDKAVKLFFSVQMLTIQSLFSNWTIILWLVIKWGIMLVIK